MQHRHGRLNLALVAAVIACALIGCGQRGKLYLPDQKTKVPAPAPQPQPNTQAQPSPEQ